MSHQDWDPIVIKKKPVKKATTSPSIKPVDKDEGEIPKLKLIDREFSQQVIKGRLEKNMNRKQLATALSLPEATIADIENGTAYHNGAIVGKIKTFLNIHK